MAESQDKVCVLITGGAGYIGSHSAKALARAGFHPVVVDDLRAGHRSSIRWGLLVVADLADKKAVGPSKMKAAPRFISVPMDISA